MADRLSVQQRHSCMSHNRSKGTKPELKLRHTLFAKGYRYRVNVRKLPGTPDIVLPKYRTVIFVNGCFWHGHKGCKYYTIPETNHEFWVEKVHRNQERDLIKIQRLESLSWNVITVWECELKSASFDETVTKVEAAMLEGKTKWESYQAKRRADSEFARAEKKRKDAIMAQVLAELQEQFTISMRIVRTSWEQAEE